jgi:Family of unknown function (DUF6527)
LSNPVDIGHGVTISFTEYEGATGGLIEEHDSPTGRCSGYVRFRVPQNDTTTRPGWIVESMNPLTLSPSILCATCKHHGFIKGGKWVPA